MTRRLTASICVALLLWAAVDDALAARTPEFDDDVAAAQDNDCLQCAPVKIPASSDAVHYLLPAGVAISSRSLDTSFCSQDRSYPASAPVYLLMSLLC